MPARRTLYTPSGSPPATVALRTPLFAGSLSPLKKANLVGSVTVVDVSESICSTTTCEWPVRAQVERRASVTSASWQS